MTKKINLVFGTTINYIRNATVSAESAVENMGKNSEIKISFLYTEKNSGSKRNKEIIEISKLSLEKRKNTKCIYYNVTKDISKFEAIRLEGLDKNILLSTYIFLLAVEKIKSDYAICLDSDLIVNSNLVELLYDFEENGKNKLIGIYEDKNNSKNKFGLIILNLKRWRDENTLSNVLTKSVECEKIFSSGKETLINYFNYREDEIYFLSKDLNKNSIYSEELLFNDEKILHYSKYNIKPWNDFEGEKGITELWWYYCRKSLFYNYFYSKNIKTKNRFLNEPQNLIDKKINYKTLEDLSLDISKNFYKIPKDIDIIVGIPRSGMIPALIIGSYLNIPVISLNEYVNGIEPLFGITRPQRYRNNPNYSKILVIDDSLNSGAAMIDAKKRIKESIKQKIIKNNDLIYAVVYNASHSNKLIDFDLCYCPQPRCFQWNILQHSFILNNACLDIDGVVCDDPTEEENDDGENYICFIKNVKPKLNTGTTFISSFVSSRLEKYRDYTENWLKKYYNYGELVLLNLPTKEERIKENKHAFFKAEIFKNRKEKYFIESELDQAIIIKRLSNKIVFCTEIMNFV